MRLVPERGWVEVDGELVADLGDQLLLFRLLDVVARASPPLPRPALFEAVWEGQRYRPPSSDNALRVALSRLRRRLGPAVTIEGLAHGGLALAGAWQVDGGVVGRGPVGRDALIAALTERMAVPSVVRLTGLPGIGKSTVAAAALARATGRVVTVELAGCGNALDAWTRIARAAGAPEARVPERAELRRAFTAATRSGVAAVLLEDVDALEAPGGAVASIVGEITAVLPRASVWLTSRVAGAVGDRVRVPPLDAASASALFVQRARAGGWDEPAGSPASLALLYRLGGHPASLLLAASLAASVGVDGALAAVEASENPSLDLQFALDALPEAVRTAARRLAPLVDGFDVPLAASVCAAPVAQVSAWLTALERSSLIEPPRAGRLRWSTAVRERLVAEASPDEIAASAQAFADEARARARVARDGRADGWLDRERGNLLGWMAHALPPEIRANLALAAATTAAVHGGVPDLVPMLTAGLEGVPPRLSAELLRARAWSRRHAGDPLGALDDLGRAASVEASPEVHALRALILIDLARWDEAEASLRAALDATGEGSDASRRRARESLGVFLLERGRAAEAAPLFVALRLDAEQAGDVRAVRRALCNLADAERQLGRWADARARLAAAEAGPDLDAPVRAHIVALRGRLSLEEGDPAVGAALLEEAARLADACGLALSAQRYRALIR
jgi:tetratricopeptide (TPR) repeat protein